MQALRLIDDWPVHNVAAAVIDREGAVHTRGDQGHSFRLASIAKPITTWACLVAVEEGIVALDQPVGQAGCTLRHLLSHAGGYGFDGPDPIAKPERNRIYSNTGIEMAAQTVADAAGIPFGDYLHEAVFQPLGMTSSKLTSSAAHGMWSTAADLTRFLQEVRSPTLISAASAAQAATVQFPALNGIIPGIGRYSPCPWGLGFEIRGTKNPHWTGTTNSPSTFGHFGGAGTFSWMDPAVGVASLALTDRPFDDWSDEALRLWPALSDALLAEASA
ncbi:MAG TPA: serine hydrolase domain-containing protein [Ilumatobacteraceae bacterium]|nr:serine hydrolase domain-containing protein [Ilumatobacteraceae bacterium]